MNKRQIELQILAEELDYTFFICDQDLLNWSHPSEALIRLFQTSREYVEAHPKFWVEYLDWSPDVLKKRISILSMNSGKLSLKLPFILGGNEHSLMTLRFSPLQICESGKLYRIGSVGRESLNLHYMKKAIQAKDSEIEISARIQKLLLAESVSDNHSGMDVAAETIPSREVDGDFYELLSLAPGVSEFIIGDVMGKGVPAALLAAAIKATYYKSLIHHGMGAGSYGDIVSIIGKIDSMISGNLIELNKFLSLYYCRFNINDSRMIFIDAGHTPFIFYDASEKNVLEYQRGQYAHGILPRIRISSLSRFPLTRTICFSFYSDGITEVRNSEGEMFGLERVLKLVSAHGYLSAEELIRNVINVIFYYAAGSFDDDVTAVAMKVKAERKDPVRQKSFILRRGGSDELEKMRERFFRDISEVYGGGKGRSSATG